MAKLLIVIPTVVGREESLGKAVASYERAALGIKHEIEVVSGQPSCGEAWRVGVEGKSFDYVLLSADDHVVLPGFFPPLIEAVKDKDMLPTPLVLNADGKLQSAGGQLGAPGDVRTDFYGDWMPVDYCPVPFLGREQWEQIGMLPIHYGSDVWVSYRGRQVGFQSCLRTESRLIHDYHPAGRDYSRVLDDKRILFQELTDRLVEA